MLIVTKTLESFLEAVRQRDAVATPQTLTLILRSLLTRARKYPGAFRKASPNSLRTVGRFSKSERKGFGSFTPQLVIKSGRRDIG